MAVCEHLRAVERELIESGAAETFRGQAWSENCREWVYFDRVLDLEGIRRRHTLDTCVVDHAHLGTHDGAEVGLVCERCKDGVMGRDPRAYCLPTAPD